MYLFKSTFRVIIGTETHKVSAYTMNLRFPELLRHVPSLSLSWSPGTMSIFTDSVVFFSFNLRWIASPWGRQPPSLTLYTDSPSHTAYLTHPCIHFVYSFMSQVFIEWFTVLLQHRGSRVKNTQASCSHASSILAG